MLTLRGLALSCELHHLTGLALQLDPAIGMGHVAGIGGDGGGRVPEGFDRPLLLELVDRLEIGDEPLAEPLVEEPRLRSSL